MESENKIFPLNLKFLVLIFKLKTLKKMILNCKNVEFFFRTKQEIWINTVNVIKEYTHNTLGVVRLMYLCRMNWFFVLKWKFDDLMKKQTKAISVILRN